MNTDFSRNEDNTLISFAWPGGYPIYYICEDGGWLCPDCANNKNGSQASTDASAPSDWRIVEQQVYWEGKPLSCDHCDAAIESAYGWEDSDET